MKLCLQRDSSPTCVQQLIGWKLLHIKNLVGRDRHRRAPIGKVVMRFLGSVKRDPDNLKMPISTSWRSPMLLYLGPRLRDTKGLLDNRPNSPCFATSGSSLFLLRNTTRTYQATKLITDSCSATTMLSNLLSTSRNHMVYD